ncbi:hypothetical protein Hanom_Chr08g00719231 [Helianthus anomalus]
MLVKKADRLNHKLQTYTNVPRSNGNHTSIMTHTIFTKTHAKHIHTNQQIHTNNPTHSSTYLTRQP